MTVTEICIIQTPPGTDTDKFLDVLAEGQKIQDDWVSRNSPGKFKGTWKFQQTEDPSVFLLAATWDEPSTHWAWIASEEDQKAAQLMVPYFAFNEDKTPKVLMFHIDGEAFGAQAAEGQVGSLSSPIISFNRHFIPAGKKDGFTAKFNEVRHLLDDGAKPYVANGGWRIEKEADRKEEWVLITGWDDVEHHQAFGRSEGFQEYRGILEFLESFDVKHYRRLA